VYLDNSVALPLLTAYALARRQPRPLKRLQRRRDAMLDRLVREYRDAVEQRDRRAEESAQAHSAPGGTETVGR